MRQLNSTSTVFTILAIENRSDRTTGFEFMNSYKTDTSGTLANNAPLFASSWMALFYVLRENFYERRAIVETAEESIKEDKE
jgi:hypothetical protein